MQRIFEIMKTADGNLLRLLAPGERRGLFYLLIFRNAAVVDAHAARGILLEKFGVVRDDDDKFIAAHLFQKRRHFFARLDVEIARRLVCENDGRVLCECAGNDRPLLFTARKFAAPPVHLLGKPHTGDEFLCPSPAFFFIVQTEERKFHVFQNGEVFYDIEVLKDGGDVLFAVLLPIAFGVVRGRLAVEVEFTFLVCIVRADNIQKRALARTALPFYRHELVIVERQIDPADTHRENIIGIVYFSDLF